MKPGPVSVPDEMLETVARRFRLLGEPARLRLLRWLESGEHTVNELAEKVHGTQANVSRHLTAMHDAGLLKRRREGTSVYYSIADPTVFRLCDLMCNSARLAASRLTRGSEGARGRGGAATRR